MKTYQFLFIFIFSLFFSFSYSQDTTLSEKYLLFKEVDDNNNELFWVISEDFLFGIANGQRKILVPPLYKQKQIKIKGNHIRIYTKQGVENLVFNTKGEIIDRFRQKPSFY